MIIAAGVLVVAVLATGSYVAVHIFSYYLVGGVSRILEEIEQPTEAK